MRHSAETTIKNRIIEHGLGWCFTPMHFSDLGSDASVRKALSQLEKQKFIRRLARGLYDYPKKHDTLVVPPPHVLKELQKDYGLMESMIFREIPAWELILKMIGQFEEEFNCVTR